MIQTVGIVGSGQMGSGIAQVCAASGFDVYLTDLAKDQLENALENIERDLSRRVSRNKMSDQDMQAAMERIQTSTKLESVAKMDLVIEAACENEELKKSIFETLSPLVSEETILASNTSSISITGLAAVTKRPDKFMGVHFMNPVPIMPFVELIPALTTADETFGEIEKFVEKLGKTHAVAQDYPGFIVNRLLMPMINEACYALYEGVGTIEAIDKGMKLGTNHPMGPLELADLIGLDTCYAIMEVLHQGLNGAKYQPCPLLLKYVEAGWLGRKTGRGFYDYSGEEPTPTR